MGQAAHTTAGMFACRLSLALRQTGRKYSLLFSLLITALLCGHARFALAYDINGFIISGDERAGWVQYDYGNPSGKPTINKGHENSRGFYVMPKLSIETPSFKNFRAKITGAGATDFGLNNHDKQSRNLVFDPSDNESFAILQELYIEYEDDQHHALVGRNEIYTPMIEHDDYYMLSNSFEVASYTFDTHQNTSLHAGYFHKMAGVWDSGANGTEFHSMSDASAVPKINKIEADDSGVSYGGVDFNNGRHRGQFWGYHAEDLYDIVFSQYNYTNKNDSFSYDAGAQFVNFSDTGALEDSITTINYSLYSLKYDAAFNNGFSVASGITKYTDGDGQGSTLGAWGGYPSFTNGLIYHFFEAGSLRNSEVYKLQGAYDLSRLGLDNMVFKARLTYYDLDNKHSISSNGRPQSYMKLYGVRLKSTFMDGGYFTGTFEYHDTDHEKRAWALRLIGGYKF
jgi:hypothetical protein